MTLRPLALVLAAAAALAPQPAGITGMPSQEYDLSLLFTAGVRRGL